MRKVEKIKHIGHGRALKNGTIWPFSSSWGNWPVCSFYRVIHTTKIKVINLWVSNCFGNDYVGSWGLFVLPVPHAANFATLDPLSLDDVDPDACWWPHLLDHVMSNSVPPHLIATAIDCNLGTWGISYTVTNVIHVRSCYYLKTLCHFTDLNMGELNTLKNCFLTWKSARRVVFL